MKRVLCFAIVIIFALSCSAAFAGDSGCGPSGTEKGGWQRMYDDMNDMFAGKSSTKDESLRGKVAKVKEGTEIEPKND